MRGSISTVIVFLISLLVVLLFQFLAKPQLARQVAAVQQENQALDERRAAIMEMELAMPLMMSRLPDWRKRLELYQVAIPAMINDDEFLAALNQQLLTQDVNLLALDLVKGGPWLGEIGETQEEELKALGIDPEVARRIQVAFYSIRLTGDFSGVLRAFESLKIYNRLYSIDQVLGPVTGGGGVISTQTDPTQTPIEITGRIYYGIPRDYLTVESLVEVFNSAVIVPKTRGIQSKIVERGQQLLTSDELGSTAGSSSTMPPEPDESAGDLAGSEEPATPLEVETT